MNCYFLCFSMAVANAWTGREADLNNKLADIAGDDNL